MLSATNSTGFYPAYPVTRVASPELTGAPPALQAGSPQELLNGTPPSDPLSAASLTEVQANAAYSITGGNGSQSDDQGGFLDTTGTVAGSAADAGKEGLKIAEATASSRAAAEAARTGAHVAPALSSAGRVAKVAGPVGTVIASGVQVFQTASDIRKIQNDSSLTESQKEQKTGEVATEGAGHVGGGIGGAAAGAALGAAAGPPGIVIGAVVGGLLGDGVGGAIGKAIGHSPIGKLVGKLFA